MSLILFVGNGINYVDKVAISWDNLLANLCSKETNDISEYLGMTLCYEYIDAISPSKSIEIKREVARVTDDKTKNITKKKDSFHIRLMNLSIDTIITTNYDYSLELSCNPYFNPLSFTKEKLYSFYRKQQAGEKTIYHIHGECRYPNSICLGFEHYAGMLEKMRNKLVTRTKKEDTKNRFHLFDVLSNLSEYDDVWYYHFFLNDIYFLGFGFDPSEEDIWWLITYRRRLKDQYPDLVTNKIVFLYVAPKKKKTKPEEMAKRCVLNSMGVDIIDLEGSTYEEKYKKAIDYLEEKTRERNRKGE